MAQLENALPELDGGENDLGVEREPGSETEWVRDWLSLGGSQGWNEETLEGRKALPDLNIALPLEVSASCHVLEPPFDNQDCLRGVEASLPELDGAQLDSMWNPGGGDSEEQIFHESGSPEDVFAGHGGRKADGSGAVGEVGLTHHPSGAHMNPGFETAPWPRRHSDIGNCFMSDGGGLMAVRVSSKDATKSPRPGIFAGIDDIGTSNKLLAAKRIVERGLRASGYGTKERAASQAPLDDPFPADLFPEVEGHVVRPNRKSPGDFFAADLSAGAAPATPGTQVIDRGQQRCLNGREQGVGQPQSGSSSGAEVDPSSVVDGLALQQLAPGIAINHSSGPAAGLAGLAAGRGGALATAAGRANRRKQSRPQPVVRENTGRRLSPGVSSQRGSHAPGVPGPNLQQQKVDVSTSSSLNLQQEEGSFLAPSDQGYNALDARDPGAMATNRDSGALNNCRLVLGDTGPDERELMALDPNHPSHLPEGSLLQSCYLVLLDAGIEGLTAREVVSKIMDRGLPLGDPDQGLPRTQVSRALQSSPYFLDIGGRFALCSNLVTQEEGTKKSMPSRKLSRSPAQEGTVSKDGDDAFMMLVLDVESEEDEDDEVQDGGDEVQENAKKIRWAGGRGGFGGLPELKHLKKRQVSTEELTEEGDEVREQQGEREMGRGKRILKKKKLWDDCLESFTSTKHAREAAKKASGGGTGAARGPGEKRKEKERTITVGALLSKEPALTNKGSVSEGESKARATSGGSEKGSGGTSRGGGEAAGAVRLSGKGKGQREMTDKELDQAVRVVGSAYRLYKRQRAKLEKEMELAKKRPRQEERETLASLKKSEAEKKREMLRLKSEKAARETAGRSCSSKDRDGSGNNATGAISPTEEDRRLGGKSASPPEAPPPPAKTPGRPRATPKAKAEKQEEAGKKGAPQEDGEAPRRCARRDNKGWVCPMLADTGRYFCAYHIERERMERERRRLKTALSKPAPGRGKVGKFGKKGQTWLPRISKGLGVKLPHKEKIIIPDSPPPLLKRKNVPETGFNALVAKRAALLLGASKTMALLGGQKTLSHIEADTIMGRPGPAHGEQPSALDPAAALGVKRSKPGRPKKASVAEQSAPAPAFPAQPAVPKRGRKKKSMDEEADGFRIATEGAKKRRSSKVAVGAKKGVSPVKRGGSAGECGPPLKGKPGRKPGLGRVSVTEGGAASDSQGERLKVAGRGNKRSAAIDDVEGGGIKAKRTKKVEDCTEEAGEERGERRPKQKKIAQVIGDGRGKGMTKVGVGRGGMGKKG